MHKEDGIENDDSGLISEGLNLCKGWYTPEERSVFAQIDREQENRDVDAFQKNHNEKLFEKIYKIRIPTLQIWARKTHYLMDSKDDMFGELSSCFAKAVSTYKKKKGSFNTWLFIFLLTASGMYKPAAKPRSDCQRELILTP